jgi:hypothetical protein
MFPELVQRCVQVFGGRPVQPQNDVAFHPATLLPQISRAVADAATGRPPRSGGQALAGSAENSVVSRDHGAYRRLVLARLQRRSEVGMHQEVAMGRDEKFEMSF